MDGRYSEEVIIIDHKDLWGNKSCWQAPYQTNFCTMSREYPRNWPRHVLGINLGSLQPSLSLGSKTDTGQTHTWRRLRCDLKWKHVTENRSLRNKLESPLGVWFQRYTVSDTAKILMPRSAWLSQYNEVCDNIICAHDEIVWIAHSVTPFWWRASLRLARAILVKFIRRTNTSIRVVMQDLYPISSCQTFKKILANDSFTSSLRYLNMHKSKIWLMVYKHRTTSEFFFWYSRPFVGTRPPVILDLNWSPDTPSPAFMSPCFKGINFSLNNDAS